MSQLHLALLSDIHIPASRLEEYRGFNPWKNLTGILPAVASSGAEGMILCGDVARLEGKTADYAEVRALFEPVAARMPVYLALGNHDDRANFRTVFAPGPGPDRAVADRHILVVEHNVARIVILDSLLHINKTPGLLGRNQREWLSSYVGTHRDRPLVIFVHHTLGDRDGDLLDADRLFALLRPHRHVKAIFFGHSHVWEVREQDRLKLINLPAVAYNFADKDPLGWVDGRFSRRGVDLTLHAFAGNRAADGGTVHVDWS
jgi:3',5'-cyclic AMP phosphodiesterase CpdA